jgi:hypothetical protein
MIFHKIVSKKQFLVVFYKYIRKLAPVNMIIKDFDEFNIYTNKEDIVSFIESTFNEEFDNLEEIYTTCIKHFGTEFRGLINEVLDYYNED